MRARHLWSRASAFMFGIVSAVLIMLASNAASAATRTVCFRLTIADGRTNCPLVGTGARRPCGQTGTWAVGHAVELWDKDPASGDDFIGVWRLSAPGNQCVTFEWELASYSTGELHPDVYLRYINEVHPSSGPGPVAYATDTNGVQLTYTNWRNGPSGDPDRYVASECTAAGACQIFGTSKLKTTQDLSTPLAQSIAAIDSAQHAIEVFGWMTTTARFDVRHPSTDPLCPATGGTLNDHVICLPTGGLATDGHLVAHEVGHVLQMREFAQNSLRDDVGSDGWSLAPNDPEAHSGATTEGFATYAGLVSWWDPGTATAPVAYGINFEAAALSQATCADNAGLPRQVVKSFWDIDDSTNEAGQGQAVHSADLVNVATSSIIDGWSFFPDGAADRQNDEASPNGVNLWDFDFHQNEDDDSFLYHNCMQSQDP